MKQEGQQPELHIPYSQQFSIDFRLVKSERVVAGGYTSWKFMLKCVIRHPTGQFTYEAADLYFHLEGFEKFYERLCAVRDGEGQTAELLDEGQMLVFRLYLEGRHLKASIRIREYQPENELITLSAGFRVEYDLFINKLCSDLSEFIHSLRSIRPEDV